MLLGTLGASLLGNLLTVKGIYRAWKVKGVVRAGYENNNNNKIIITIMMIIIIIMIKWIFNTASYFN